MKKFLFAVVMICQLILAGTLCAEIVDFSTLGANTIDITKPSGYTIGDVAFSYDNQGFAGERAYISSNGINGSTVGPLMIDFASPVSALSFNFSLVNATAADPDALFITLTNSITNAFIDLLFSTNASGNGNFSYTGGAYDKASMFFDTSTPTFTLDTVSYTPDVAGAVPEPASMMLLVCGLLSLVGLKVRPTSK